MSPPPYAGPPRRRPSAGWFAVGGILTLLAPLVFVGGLLWTLRPLLSPDGHFPADGRLHAFSLPAHSQRAVFLPDDAIPPSCRTTDADGTELPVRGVSGSYTSTFGHTSYSAYRTFETGTGEVLLSCRMPATAAPVRMYVAGVPSTSAVITGVLVSVVVPIVLVLLGLAVIVVVALLRSRRPGSLQRPTDPASPASWG